MEPRKLEPMGMARARGSCTDIVAWGSGDRPRQVRRRGNIWFYQLLSSSTQSHTHVPPGQLPSVPRQSVKVSQVDPAQNWVAGQSELAVQVASCREKRPFKWKGWAAAPVASANRMIPNDFMSMESG